MECLHVCELLSAAADSEVVDPAALAEARAHASTCAQCRAFARTLVLLDSLPAPVAPPELVARLERIAVDSAAAQRELVTAAPFESAAQASAPPQRRTPEAWLRRMVTFGAAAAVVLLVAGVAGIAMLGLPGSRQTTQDRASSDLPFDGTAATTPDTSAGTAEDATTMMTTAPAPDYVTLDGSVWLVGSVISPLPSQAATAGVVTSTLGGAATDEHTAHSAPVDPLTLYVQSGGAYIRCTRVVRYLGRAAYGLVSGDPIVDYGMWPTLPSRFAPPQQSDGSPTFRRFGFDDLSVDVYVPAGGRIQDGFAVSPGTDATDPAAGNPNWTWWERID